MLKDTQEGRFITLEGGEGVGKSTNLAFVVDFLRQEGREVLVTREPGGTALGEALREILLDPKQEDIKSNTELLMMFAARSQHIETVILPALLAGTWVVCDRFTDASYAYQGGGRGISFEKIAILEAWVQQSLQPDLVLLLDAPIEVGMERIQVRNHTDRFEREGRDFYEKVRAAYLQRAKAAPERYQVIDASQNLPDVQQQLASVLQNFI